MCDVMGAFHQLCILPCLRISKYLIVRLMYRIHTNFALQNFHGFFECNKDVHHHNTRRTNHFHFVSFSISRTNGQDTIQKVGL